MNTNYSQAKSLIISAISDVEIILNSIKKKFFSLVAYKSQFAVEKLNKALLSLFGLKIEKTPTPSDILKDFLSETNTITLDNDVKELIQIILRCSSFFESQGTKTRYGIVQEKKLIIAEEIYDKLENIKDFISNLVEMINSYLILLEKTFKINDQNFQELKRLKKYIKSLKKVS